MKDSISFKLQHIKVNAIYIIINLYIDIKMYIKEKHL